jgi:hypothetical protein
MIAGFGSVCSIACLRFADIIPHAPKHGRAQCVKFTFLADEFRTVMRFFARFSHDVHAKIAELHRTQGKITPRLRTTIDRADTRG